MSDVRLYAYCTGSLGCRYQDVFLNEGLGQPYEIPVPWYLIRHPKGDVVIDGGIPIEAAKDPHKHWGAVSEVFVPRLRLDETCVSQLAATGVHVDTVKFVLLSHLHLDHTGAIGRFPNARHIVQRREMSYALAPDWFCRGAFIRADFDRPDLEWDLLDEGWGDGYDVFGDGTIVCLQTPGHTVGHQSFLVRTPRCRVLLAVDAADTLAHWNERALPGAVASTVDAVRSVRRLRAIAEREDAVVITGHDPEQWSGLRKAPDYY